MEKSRRKPGPGVLLLFALWQSLELEHCHKVYPLWAVTRGYFGGGSVLVTALCWKCHCQFTLSRTEQEEKYKKCSIEWFWNKIVCLSGRPRYGRPKECTGNKDLTDVWDACILSCCVAVTEVDHVSLAPKVIKFCFQRFRTRVGFMLLPFLSLAVLS